MTVKTPADPKVKAELEELAVKTIRVLAAEAVEKAKSGHPGLPMGCADVAYVLFTQFLKFNPRNPSWTDRDRFVLSAGHGSMLLYSMLHLTGYDLSMEDLKQFRQWGSKTPGHPEHGETPGVEATTGPLGQGFGNAVGMAIAERWLAARFNTPDHAIVDHHTFGICSDGDLMEGVSHEAASIAGHLKLGKIVFIYDDNGITIEGHTDLAFSENIARRFDAYGWHVLKVNGHDRKAVAAALDAGRREAQKPTLIIARTTIAFGSPNKAGTHEAHGSPLGEEELALTRKNLGWDQPPFTVPDGVRALFMAAGEAGEAKNRKWSQVFDDYRGKYPEKAALWERIHARKLPEGIESVLPAWKPEDKPIATRSASGKAINALAKALPELTGGSADLAPSTNTLIEKEASIAAGNFGGRNFHFGIREHGMGAILNGLSLHGGIRPYGATFLIFSDYMRPTIRLAALMHQPVIYVFTHDSVFLGEDGPTHQPIEHLPALRAIPNLRLIRPADANETAAAWLLALENTRGPTALVLTRQNLPILNGAAYGKGIERGGYVIDQESGGDPEVILIASGSEVAVALEAARILRERQVKPRVVSLPCWDLFAAQPKEYRDAVLPPRATRRLAIEAAAPFGWERWVGAEGKIIGIERFGASAPLKALAEKFGFTGAQVAEAALKLLGR